MLSPVSRRGWLVRLLAAGGVLAAASVAGAQRPDGWSRLDRPAYERIAQERGLSNGTVTAMVQDRTGHLWLGTEDGLNRYGGAGFTVFRTIQGDSTTIADGWITGLAVAPDGTLWAATLHGGVHRFDARTEQFRRYRHADGDGGSLSSDRVNAVLATADGAIWAGTARGVDRLDPRTGRVRRYTIAPEPAAPANDVLALAPDSSGKLWVGGREGLYLLDPTTGALDAIRDVEPWVPVRAILRDRRGVQWIGTENALVAIDPRTRRVVARHGQPTASRPSPIAGRALALAEAPDGTLLIGSDGGLTRLDPATGRWTRDVYDRDDPRSLGGTIVRAVLVDRGAVLWAGLESYGVSKHAPAGVRFEVLRHDPAASNTLSNDYVRGMTEDRAGNLWIATQFGGLNRRDRRTGRLTAYRPRAGDPRSLPGDNVWAVHEDRAGKLWVGLHHGGLGTLDPRTGTFTRSPFVPAGASVNVIVEDRAGALLVGLEGDGLVEISADRRRARTFGATVGDVRVLANNDVQTVFEDAVGDLWVGGFDGLSRLDRRTLRAARFRAVPGRAGALGTDFVTHAIEDRTGTVWVATKGAGMARYDRRTGRFTSFGVADGLPHAFVYGILEDARGRLWLSTDDGIAAFDPRSGAVMRFGLADGLQAREFNRRAFARGRDGTLYFGGINGVNAFRPDGVVSSPPPIVAIVSLRRADGETALVPGDTAVRLRHGDAAFTIAFAAFDFTAPEKTRYVYRLDRVDRDWVAAGDRREASYASVPPGRYVFQVRAANASGLWSRDGAAVAVIVESAWWATWWARLLGALGVAAVVAAGIYLRLHAAHRVSERLARRVEEQTRDLTEAQARLREALEREREVARELVDVTAAVPGAVFQLRETPDGRRSFRYVSEGVVPLYPAGASDGGAPRRVAERLVAQIHPDDRAEVRHSLAVSREALAAWHAEFRVVAPDGTARWLEAHARPARDADGATVWTGVVTDATVSRRAEAERAALEARVLHAQKAESLAVLAGGIAHDFNNLLVGVLANADLLREEVPADGDAAETVALIRASALRAAELTQQMLAYAGRGRLVVERVDLARLVPEMLALVRSAVPRTIAFDVHVDAERVPVEGDATQLRQVVMNLATNAAEAIGDRAGGGRVSVRVAVESAPQRELALRHAAQDMPTHGPYAVLQVTDDGCGMDASVVDRIFDPFFTTKFTGRGLGLAALLGVVRAHHGGLRVVSAPGHGASFALYLPLATAVAAPPPAPAAPEPAAPARGARVLVVDDEPAIVRTLDRILRAAGHDVVSAADGVEALERLAADEAIDVVLMDMTMPRMNGLEAANALREHGRAVPVILMSGYSAEEIAGRGASAGIDGFLKKPFSTAEVRAVLEAVVAQASR